MNDTMGNEGINKLAGVFQGRMKNVSDKPQALDFGMIQEDMSLTTNKFPKSIPQADYMVCRQLTLGLVDDILTETQLDGSHMHPGITGGTHRHDVMIPENMRSIKPGDRVLVAWVGDDACVVDIILPGTAV